MFLATGRASLLLACLATAGLATAGLGGCSFAPFPVEGSEDAAVAASAQAAGLLPRLQPRAIGVCYSPAFNEPAEVEAEAIYLCEGGRLERLDEDFFWNGCSLSQPHRVNYVCYPADKAKRAGGGTTAN